MGAFLTSFLFKIFQIVKIFDSSEHSSAHGRPFLVLSLNLHPTICYGLQLTYQVTQWIGLINDKDGNVFVLTYDEQMHSPFWEQRKRRKTRRLKFIFYRFNSWKLYVTWQQRKFRLWIMFYNHPVLRNISQPCMIGSGNRFFLGHFVILHCFGRSTLLQHWVTPQNFKQHKVPIQPK